MSRVSAGDPARAALDTAVLAWMREAPDSASNVDDARFDRIARDLFAWQFERCAPYARFCEGRGVTPGAAASWREIPAVPAGAFKELALRSFPERATVKTFRTSGTAAERRGELHLDTLALYEASVLPSFVVHVLPELADLLGGNPPPPTPAARPDRRPRLRILAPSAQEAPDSSLSHMFAVLARELAWRGGLSDCAFDVAGGEVRVGGLVGALERALADAAPVVLCGTAFAFVHVLDALASRSIRLALPPGSRVMETGGFKGRSRELTRDALYAQIEERLGIPPERCVNQYGMTELASQFHDSVLRFPGTPRRKLGPPWTRVRLVSPETGEDVPAGAVGMIAVYDLGNTGSVLAVQTADLGRAVGDGFEVLGREPGAEARGCSLALDEMVADAAGSRP